MDTSTMNDKLISNAAKVNLINTIIADYFEFGDAEKDARGVLLAVMTVVSYGEEV